MERLKSERTGIGGDQRRCWTVERICVTAISKTITPVAPTGGTRNLLLWSELTDLTLSQRTPLCSGGRPHQSPGPNSRQATLTASCSATSLRRHELSAAYRQREIHFPHFVALQRLLWEGLNLACQDRGEEFLFFFSYQTVGTTGGIAVFLQVCFFLQINLW